MEINEKNLKDLETIVREANERLTEMSVEDQSIINALYKDGDKDNRMDTTLCSLQGYVELLADNCQILSRQIRNIRELKNVNDLYERLVLGRSGQKEIVWGGYETLKAMCPGFTDD